MKGRNAVIDGFSGGDLIFVLLFGLNFIINQIITYDISKFNGMRPIDDPVMMFFFAYPLIVAFTAAYLYDLLHPVLQGSIMKNGVAFGFILLVIVTLPSNFPVFTSMDWPVTFSIGNLIWAIIGFLFTGNLYARIWKAEETV